MLRRRDVETFSSASTRSAAANRLDALRLPGAPIAETWTVNLQDGMAWVEQALAQPSARVAGTLDSEHQLTTGR